MTEPSPNRGVMITLAYLWLLAVVPLVVEKGDPEIRWHARHGLLLTVAELALLCLYLVLVGLVSLSDLRLGFALGLLLVLVWLGVLGLHVSAIIKGVNGGRLVVPGISRHVDRF